MPTTQTLILPNNSRPHIDEVKQRAQQRNATSIKEEPQGDVTTLTITYPDDPNVKQCWTKEAVVGKPA
jgi:hypothetical protein